jgi:hypothetical protein
MQCLCEGTHAKTSLVLCKFMEKKEETRERDSSFIALQKKFSSGGWLFCVSVPPTTQIQVRRQSNGPIRSFCFIRRRVYTIGCYDMLCKKDSSTEMSQLSVGSRWGRIRSKKDESTCLFNQASPFWLRFLGVGFYTGCCGWSGRGRDCW